MGMQFGIETERRLLLIIKLIDVTGTSTNRTVLLS